MDNGYKLQKGDVYAWRDSTTGEILVGIYGDSQLTITNCITDDNVKLIKTADEVKYMFPKILTVEEQAKQDEEDNKICINIWDDYCEEEGGTSMLFEGDDPSLETQKKVWDLVISKIKETGLVNEKNYYLKLEKYRDWKTKEFTRERYDLTFTKLPHKIRERLVKKLEKMKLEVDGVPLHIYSES